MFKLGYENIFAVSSTDKKGKEEILDKLEQILSANSYNNEGL